MSLWLNSGVPATEVVRRAGHGVAVLLKIYAHCIDGQADAANKRITDALATQDAQPNTGDEGDGDIEAGILKWAGQRQEAGQDGQHTAPTLAVRARPCAAQPQEPGAHGQCCGGCNGGFG